MGVLAYDAGAHTGSTHAHPSVEAALVESSTTRKLATIVALDVAGYSARTEADEAKMTAEVADLRHAFDALRDDPRNQALKANYKTWAATRSAAPAVK